MPYGLSSSILSSAVLVPDSLSTRLCFLTPGFLTLAKSAYCATHRILGGSGGNGQINCSVGASGGAAADYFLEAAFFGASFFWANPGNATTSKIPAAAQRRVLICIR